MNMHEGKRLDEKIVHSSYEICVAGGGKLRGVVHHVLHPLQVRYDLLRLVGGAQVAEVGSGHLLGQPTRTQQVHL